MSAFSMCVSTLSSCQLLRKRQTRNPQYHCAAPQLSSGAEIGIQEGDRHARSLLPTLRSKWDAKPTTSSSGSLPSIGQPRSNSPILFSVPFLSVSRPRPRPPRLTPPRPGSPTTRLVSSSCSLSSNRWFLFRTFSPVPYLDPGYGLHLSSGTLPRPTFSSHTPQAQAPSNKRAQHISLLEGIHSSRERFSRNPGSRVLDRIFRLRVSRGLDRRDEIKGVIGIWICRHVGMLSTLNLNWLTPPQLKQCRYIISTLSRRINFGTHVLSNVPPSIHVVQFFGWAEA